MVKNPLCSSWLLSLKGVVWEIYECVSEVLSHLGRMFGMIFRVHWGQKSYQTGDSLYTYKGLVAIPPLGMIDNELTMAECGIQSTLTNVMINNFTESKNLKFGIEKCKKMHIGEHTILCDDIKVHDQIGERVSTINILVTYGYK